MKNKAATQPRSKHSAHIRVLMADPDESLHCEYLGPLAHEGFDMVPALSVLDCLAKLREHVLDVLVLEPQLPGGGGDGVLARMGEVPQLAKLPIIVLTSCRDPHLLDRVARFPISDYHLKPLAPHKLVLRLRNLLAHPRLRFTLKEHTGRLKCSIERRTGGRVRNLRVEAVEGKIIVCGHSESHHVKHLALVAVQETCAASETPADKIELNIEVSHPKRA